MLTNLHYILTNLYYVLTILNYVLTNLHYIHTNIHYIFIYSGKLLTEISDAAVRNDSYVFDLHVTKNTLIVPRYSDRKVLFYQIG